MSQNITKDSIKATFTVVGGSYLLKDRIYIENLEYFSDPQWENHKYKFVEKFQNDTLVQKGVEKLEKIGINRMIVEKYVGVK